MVSGLVLALAGTVVGAVALVIAAWREYFKDKSAVVVPELVVEAPTAAQLDAESPSAPPPPPPSKTSGFSFSPAAVSGRTAQPPSRYVGSYVRRAAPKRSTATRKPVDTEDGPQERP